MLLFVPFYLLTSCDKVVPT